MSAFGYIFSEIIQYSQRHVKGIQDLEKRYPGPPPWWTTHENIVFYFHNPISSLFTNLD
jgi:hypothetical protein